MLAAVAQKAKIKVQVPVREKILSWLNGENIKPISGAKCLQDAVVDCSLRSMVYLSKEKNINFFYLSGKIRAHRSSGCASLAICKIAQGSLDIYLSAYLYIWDYAAARIILEEMHVQRSRYKCSTSRNW